MRTDLFDYTLPPELIAQTPLPRGQSRLLVLGKDDGAIRHCDFSDLLSFLRAGDTLVLNDTRVTARRLEARRENGMPAEVFLLRPVEDTCWEALVRPGRSLKPGKTVEIVNGPGQGVVTGHVVRTTESGGRILEFADKALRDALAHWGTTPLPPYIHTPLPAAQENRYQTVYATADGSAAAPTAGLHFTPEILACAEAKGVRLAKVTLHVGVGTFRPVRTEDIEAHEMHSERLSVTQGAADIVNATQGRVIAVGTTSVRSLETASEAARDRLGPGERIAPYSGESGLFITPGYRFRAVDALITNFHLPRSTLLMLVCALAGREHAMRAYEEAIGQRYRFFSFGDAMLIA